MSEIGLFVLVNLVRLHYITIVYLSDFQYWYFVSGASHGDAPTVSTTHQPFLSSESNNIHPENSTDASAVYVHIHDYNSYLVK